MYSKGSQALCAFTTDICNFRANVRLSVTVLYCIHFSKCMVFSCSICDKFLKLHNIEQMNL